MALSSSITKTLRFKPEVNKIFDDLEAWHDYCRMELIDFNPAHLYKSREWREFNKTREYLDRKVKREQKQNKKNHG